MNSKFYRKRRRITCGACRNENQPVDLYHAPEICVDCAIRLRNIDYIASNPLAIRREMRQVGIPTGGGGAIEARILFTD